MLISNACKAVKNYTLIFSCYLLISGLILNNLKNELQKLKIILLYEIVDGKF